MKFLIILFLFYSAIIFSQTNNSTKIKNNFTTADTVRQTHKDTLTIIDTLKVKKVSKPDTLVAIYQKPFDSNSDFVNRKTINFLDYRYTGDFFQPIIFNFKKDYGFIGQPNETMLYGLGLNAVSYFEDGVLQNNRLPNSLDLNYIQTENIDSVETIPLPRGFLYGPINNPVSVNFISRDFISPKPFSRIKYYQGPSGEAMLDGIFNERIYNKFNIYFEITNRKVDTTESYANSAFSIWQAKTQLKYFLSDKINITGTYSFDHSIVGLNGGVNVDSISKLSSDINYYLYNGLEAPVNFPNRDQSYKKHFFNLRLLGKFWKDSFTDINFYYNYDYTELNQFHDTSFYKTVDKNKIYGIALRQDYNKDVFNFQFNGNFETSDIKYYSLTNNNYDFIPVNYHNFSASVIAAANLADSCLIPSIYYKISNRSGNNNCPIFNGTTNGFGADLTYKGLDYYKFYLGFSFYSTGAQSNLVKNYEAGVSVSFENIFADIRLFGRKDFNVSGVNLLAQAALNSNIIYNSDLLGIGAKLNFNFWKIYLETQTSYYASGNSSGLVYLLPKINFTGGIYYKDILFNENLNLKTGFAFYYIGKRSSSVGDLSPAYKLDFTTAGEIQKVAIVYFTWENLFDNTYYIIPYYPMPRRGIRFGIAWELFN